MAAGTMAVRAPAPPILPGTTAGSSCGQSPKVRGRHWASQARPNCGEADKKDEGQSDRVEGHDHSVATQSVAALRGEGGSERVGPHIETQRLQKNCGDVPRVTQVGCGAGHGQVCRAAVRQRREHATDPAKVDIDANRDCGHAHPGHARTTLAKTKATNRTTEIAMADVRPMPPKLAIETIIPTPVIWSWR